MIKCVYPKKLFITPNSPQFITLSSPIYGVENKATESYAFFFFCCSVYFILSNHKYIFPKIIFPYWIHALTKPSNNFKRQLRVGEIFAFRTF